MKCVCVWSLTPGITLETASIVFALQLSDVHSKMGVQLHKWLNFEVVLFPEHLNDVHLSLGVICSTRRSHFYHRGYVLGRVVYCQCL